VRGTGRRVRRLSPDQGRVWCAGSGCRSWLALPQDKFGIPDDGGIRPALEMATLATKAERRLSGRWVIRPFEPRAHQIGLPLTAPGPPRSSVRPPVLWRWPAGSV